LILQSFFLVLLAATSLAGQTNRPPIALSIDLADAPRKILHARLSIPVQPGPLTLVYPQWIPGEHGPTGPIDNLAGIVFTANGQPLAWRRDDVDMFAFHLDVPSGVNTVEAKTDFLATAAPSGFSAGASTSANLTIISWNQVLLCPADIDASQVTVEPSVKLPDGWKFATALAETSKTGDMVHFEAVPLNKLVDSPVLAGKFFKEIPLAPEITPKHFLDIAADGPEDLKITDEGMKSLEYTAVIQVSGSAFRSIGVFTFLSCTHNARSGMNSSRGVEMNASRHQSVRRSLTRAVSLCCQ
jgi:predicted metalloprotease with PDZ domain